MGLRMIARLWLNPVTIPGAALFFLLGCCGTAPHIEEATTPPALLRLPVPGSPQLLEWLALAAPWQSKGVCPGVSVAALRPVLRTFRVHIQRMVISYMCQAVPLQLCLQLHREYAAPQRKPAEYHRGYFNANIRFSKIGRFPGI